MREETRRKYELVIYGYLSNLTMAAAYMEVYPNSSLSTARIEGWKVIHNEKMSDYIEQKKPRYAMRWSESMESLGIH